MRKEVGVSVSRKREGFIAVSLPYVGNDLQFLVLLPDDVNGLRALESKLTASMLAECAKLETRQEVDLHLPKFKFEPPTIALAEKLRSARDERRVRYSTRQREFRWDRAAEAE